jgi:hypothetical protein
MLTIILIILIAAIVVAAYRWEEVERRLFPDDAHQSPQPQAHTHHADAAATAAPAEPIHEPRPRAGRGMMHKRPLQTEPDVDPAAFQKPSVTEAPPKDFKSPVNDSGDTPQPSAPPAAAQPTAPDLSPGAQVSGAPAMPSQPAYVDATSAVSESVADLSTQADKAFHDRDYKKAEKLCLKILLKEPRNHKYMTRIGQVYKETGQLEDAKEAFEEAKKLDPKNFFVLNQLVEVERLLSDKGGRTKPTS